jgi:hypothetical protein
LQGEASVVRILRPATEERELAECEVPFAAIGAHIGDDPNTLNPVNDDAHPAAVAVEPFLLADGNLQDTMGHPAPAAQIAPAASEVEELALRIGAVLGACPRLEVVVHTRHGVGLLALRPEEAPLEQADLRLLLEQVVFER